MSDALYDADLNGAAIQQISDARFSPNNRIAPAFTSAGITPSALYLMEGAPRHAMTSMDLAGVLGAISATAGLNVTSGAGVFPWNKRADGGTFAGATSHFTLTSAEFFSWIESLAGGTKEDAQAVVNTVFRSTDGQTAPVTANTGQSLSAAGFGAVYRLALVKLNNGGGLTQVTGAMRATVNFGITVRPKELTDGEIFPTAWYLTRQVPFMDLEFNDLDKNDEANFGLLFQTLTGVQVFFQKRAAGGTLVSSATAEHVQCSFADAINDVQQLSGSNDGDATCSWRIHGEAITASATATF